MSTKTKKKKKEIFPVSTEDAAIFVEAIAMANLRDKYTRRFRGYKNAKKAAIETVKLEMKFWNKMAVIYPKLFEEQEASSEITGISYNRGTNVLSYVRKDAPAN